MIQENPPRRRLQSALLAEDDEMIREIVSTYLERLGYKVYEAQDGTKALDIIERLENGPFDLVVTDLLMPGASGESVVMNALNQDACERFLIISGFSPEMPDLDPTVREIALYLEKPFTFDAFEEKVEILERQ